MTLNWNDYPNFTLEELDDGGPEPASEFMRKLQLARWICYSLCKEAGITPIKFHITSGSRSIEKNRQVGGKDDSTHLYGRACDIAAITSRDRFFIVKSLMLAGFTRIGVNFKKKFIHVDDGEYIEELNKEAFVLFGYEKANGN